MKDVRRLLSWLWTGSIATVLVVALLMRGPETNAVDGVLEPFAALSIVLMAGFGAVISTRQPGNRIAWLFQAISVLFLLVIGASIVVDGIDPASPEFPDAWDLAAIFILYGISLALFHAVFLLLYVFPTGVFLTRRWSWAGWSAVVLAPVSLLAIVFAEQITEGFVDDPWQISNPIGFLPYEIFEIVNIVWLIVLTGVAVGGVIALVFRYRRSDPVIRAQVKWVLFAAVVAAVCLPVGWGDFALSGVFTLGALVVIPFAITIAITRYKLYEIDRLISRTISYAIVAAALVAVFATGAVWLPTRLLGEQPSILVAASTLAVAALFNPLRRRVQHVVDKRFNRSSYEADRVAEEFTAELRDSLTVEQLAEAWVRTVDSHLEPEVSGIWLNDPRGRSVHRGAR